MASINSDNKKSGKSAVGNDVDELSSILRQHLVISSTTPSTTTATATATTSLSESKKENKAATPAVAAAAASIAPLLILFDLGGTWIRREQRPLRHVDSSLVTLVPIEELTKNKKYIYYRSCDLDVWFNLQKHSYVQLGVYTTISNRYAEPIVRELQQMVQSQLRDDAKTVPPPLLFTQDHCKPDATQRGGHGWQYSLDKVWASPKCGGRYNTTNTILINDEEPKARSCIKNSIIFSPSFNPNAPDDAMARLGTHLEKLLTEWQQGSVPDVRTWIKANPFK